MDDMMDLANRIDRALWTVQDMLRRWPWTVIYIVLWLLTMSLYLALGGRP